MTNIPANLRKAAVLLRSLDADTAAMMLSQLSDEEAASIREAIRALGAVGADEQVELADELRRTKPTGLDTKRASNGAVELALSMPIEEAATLASTMKSSGAQPTRFEFLESAPTSALAPYLAREHAQTIAVVLSHLPPERAAAVLADLPRKVRSETVERLSALGEADPETIRVLERELEAWIAKRSGTRGGPRRRDTMAAILDAADANTRERILSDGNRDRRSTIESKEAAKSVRHKPMELPRPPVNNVPPAVARVAPRAEQALPRVAFDDLVHFDSRALAAVWRHVDANVLALALAGSHDELVDRVCEQMPKQTARAFRRELRRLGPTRLSDVAAAQRVVADVAARHIAKRQPAPPYSLA